MKVLSFMVSDNNVIIIEVNLKSANPLNQYTGESANSYDKKFYIEIKQFN
ncbi:hypothetical protein LLG07_06170 [bacterium]|nr:hypothetical protein [bacterium]